jgi:hypothetical protein
MISLVFSDISTHSATGIPMCSHTSCIRKRSRMRRDASMMNSSRSRSSLAVMSS